MLTAPLLQIALQQHGVLLRAQLTDHGVSQRALSRARIAGTVVDVTTRVVRVASCPDSFEARCHAIDLHVGDLGFVAERSAGKIQGLRSMWPRPIAVTIPAGHRVHLPAWTKVHHSSWFDIERDRVTTGSGIRVAEPHRMLWGLAALLGHAAFERAAEDAWHLQLVSPTSAAAYLEQHRCRGKDGTIRLEQWLEKSIAQRRPSQSGLELDLLRALERAGAPTPERQFPIRLRSGRTIHVDIAWPDVRLAVEPGHSWWHGGNRAMSRDLDRKLAAAELGWDTMHLDEQLLASPDLAARRVLRALRARQHLLHPPEISADPDADRPHPP